MKTLVLDIEQASLRYAYFPGGRHPTTAWGFLTVSNSSDVASLARVLERVRSRHGRRDPELVPDLLAVRIPYGGACFGEPVLATSSAIRQLETVARGAPMNLEPNLALLRACEEVFSSIPTVLVFETAFFVRFDSSNPGDSPPHEDGTRSGVSRLGVHGIFHEAACDYAEPSLHANPSDSTPQLLSVCLEPQVEVVATANHRVVMAVSGIPPLPGSGEQALRDRLARGTIDRLARQTGWSPERVHEALVLSESAFMRLGGRTILTRPTKSLLPRAPLGDDVLRCHLLSVFAEAMSLIGGLDAIVYSGRFAHAGRPLHSWLMAQEAVRAAPRSPRAEPLILPARLEQVIAGTATSLLAAKNIPTGSHPAGSNREACVPIKRRTDTARHNSPA